MTVPFSHTFLVKRFGQITDLDGTYDKGTPTEIDFVGNIQPLSGEERKVLPEGSREKKSISVFTQQEIKGSNQTNRTPADIIVYENEEYEVFRVENYSNTVFPLPHFEAVAIARSNAINNRGYDGLG